jgi:polygalacturonase
MFRYALASGLSLLAVVANASPLEARASCTISTYTDVSNVSGCTTITIAKQTVPGGKSLALTGLKDGTTVQLSGDVTFGTGTYWTGTLFSLSGGKIAFNGNGHTIDGNGAYYCGYLLP